MVIGDYIFRFPFNDVCFSEIGKIFVLLPYLTTKFLLETQKRKQSKGISESYEIFYFVLMALFSWNCLSALPVWNWMFIKTND